MCGAGPSALTEPPLTQATEEQHAKAIVELSAERNELRDCVAELKRRLATAQGRADSAVRLLLPEEMLQFGPVQALLGTPYSGCWTAQRTMRPCCGGLTPLRARSTFPCSCQC